MVAFALWETIGLERLRMCVYCKSVGCCEGVAAGGCTLGTLVVSYGWSCTLGTIVGSFDLTITIGTSVGVEGLLGGSRRLRLLNMSLRPRRFFLYVVPSGGRVFTDGWSVVLSSLMVLRRSSYLGGMGSLRLPRGNHLLVSSIQTPSVERINILKQR